MRLDRAFLLSNLMLILVSVGAHEAASGGFVYLAITAALCWLLWSRRWSARLPRLGELPATLICLAAFAMVLYRGVATTSLHGMQLLDISVPVVGHFLIVFQWVSLFRQKRPNQYGWIYLVSLVHIGIAGLLMPGPWYAVFFLLYALVGICTLTVYHVWLQVRETDERREMRFGAGFFLAVIPATLALMIPVAGVFVLLPRRAQATPLVPRLIRLAMQPVSGFSPTVRFGDIGQIQANPRQVMHMTIRDPETGEPLKPSGLLLRGLALDTYVRQGDHWLWKMILGEGKWVRISFSGGGDTSVIYRESFPGFKLHGYRRIQCDITLEPLQTRLLFAPFAPESVILPRRTMLVANWWHHALGYRRRNPTQLRYTVISRLFSPSPPAEGSYTTDLPPAMRRAYLSLPSELSPRILRLARRIAPTDQSPDGYSKTVRIQEYLSDAGRFRYTLRMDPTPGVEPVEDFLFNLRKGHCEYFASAMVLLLRSLGVPARLVNGFRVTEWNPIGGYYVVRQSDAHSWVEAYLRPHGWRTFDPGVLRDAAIPRPMFVRRWWRNVHHLAVTAWVRHVVTFDVEHQAKIYRPIGKAAGNLRWRWKRAASLLGAALHDLSRWQVWRYVSNPWPKARWVLLGGATLVAVLLLTTSARWIRSLSRANRSRTAASQFYGRMERLLARRGFRRYAWQSPWEFHDALVAHGWPATEAVAAITRSFCATRYGGRMPSEQQVRKISQALETIRRTKWPRRSEG